MKDSLLSSFLSLCLHSSLFYFKFISKEGLQLPQARKILGIAALGHVALLILKKFSNWIGSKKNKKNGWRKQQLKKMWNNSMLMRTMKLGVTSLVWLNVSGQQFNPTFMMAMKIVPLAVIYLFKYFPKLKMEKTHKGFSEGITFAACVPVFLSL